MIGRRIPTANWEEIIHMRNVQPEDYWNDYRSGWMVCVPVKVEQGIGCLASLKYHKVEEHEDGTITVTPSIVVETCNYHGFLIRGQWSNA